MNIPPTQTPFPRVPFTLAHRSAWCLVLSGLVGLSCSPGSVAPDGPDDSQGDGDAGTDGAICATATEGVSATLSCPSGQTISAVDFASYGTPTGSCGSFAADDGCHATTSQSVVEAACVGNAGCTFEANDATFGDPCLGTAKHLDVQVRCSAGTCTPSCSGKACDSEAASA